MRPSRGLGPQRTILCFLVAFRSGLRALLLVTTESHSTSTELAAMVRTFKRWSCYEKMGALAEIN